MVRIKKSVHLFTNSNILINNLHPTFKSPLSSKSVKSVVSLVLGGEKCKLTELSINLVDNPTIKKINKKYLSHSYYTDIITFPYNNNKSQIEGEIFISLDTVKKNAQIYNTGYKNELKRVIIHGCLHLAGYNDKTKQQKELIRGKENFYIKADSKEFVN